MRCEFNNYVLCFQKTWSHLAASLSILTNNTNSIYTDSTFVQANLIKMNLIWVVSFFSQAVNSYWEIGTQENPQKSLLIHIPNMNHYKQSKCQSDGKQFMQVRWKEKKCHYSRRFAWRHYKSVSIQCCSIDCVLSWTSGWRREAATLFLWRRSTALRSRWRKRIFRTRSSSSPASRQW